MRYTNFMLATTIAPLLPLVLYTAVAVKTARKVGEGSYHINSSGACSESTDAGIYNTPCYSNVLDDIKTHHPKELKNLPPSIKPIIFELHSGL